MTSVSVQLPLFSEEKTCSVCGETKSLSEFYLKRPGLYYPRCKICYNARCRERWRIRKDPVLRALDEAERARRDEPPSEKQCSRCLRTVPISDFRERSDSPGKYISWCRPCEREHQRHYSKAHKIALRAKRPAYVATHRAQIQEYARRHREANPERYREYQRKKIRKNPEANRARLRQWAQENPDRARASQFKRKRLRRARESGNNGSFTLHDWERIKARFNWTCLCCGKREPEITLQADHVVPLAMGGWNIASNLQSLCPACNVAKGTKFIDYRPGFFRTLKG